MQEFFSTIAAIATPPGVGGIGVIRISGPKAIETAQAVFAPVSKISLQKAAGYTAHYGRIFDDDGVFDDAVATVFRAPKSYTGEDVVELSCHGGLYLLNRALRAVFDAGAETATPGEFTRRAYLNGKMSLTAAESVMDLIGAKGKQAARVALAGRDGLLSKETQKTSDKLVDLAALLAAWNDYPDEDFEEIDPEKLALSLHEAEKECQKLLDTFSYGKILHEGVDTVIVGRPNVGKSTLMNLLSGAQKSIVTEIPGTTRDIVEESVLAGEVLLRLADTAGIHKTDDPVEKIGVDLAQKRLDSAQLVLAILDRSEEIREEDRQILPQLAERPAILILNKSDLPAKIAAEDLAAYAVPVVEISAKTGEGARQLIDQIAQTLHIADLDAGAPIVANERQRACLQKAQRALRETIDALRAGVTLDAVTVCLDEALSPLLELSGQRANEAVVDAVFANFCVGK